MSDKLGCVIRIVVGSIMPDSEFRPNAIGKTHTFIISVIDLNSSLLQSVKFWASASAN